MITNKVHYEVGDLQNIERWAEFAARERFSLIEILFFQFRLIASSLFSHSISPQERMVSDAG